MWKDESFSATGILREIKFWLIYEVKKSQCGKVLNIKRNHNHDFYGKIAFFRQINVFTKELISYNKCAINLMTFFQFLPERHDPYAEHNTL